MNQQYISANLGICTREIWLLTTKGCITVSIVNKPEASLILADALNRAHIEGPWARVTEAEGSRLGFCRIQVHHDAFSYNPGL